MASKAEMYQQACQVAQDLDPEAFHAEGDEDFMAFLATYLCNDVMGVRCHIQTTDKGLSPENAVGLGEWLLATFKEGRDGKPDE